MMRNPCEKGSHNKHAPAFCTHKRVHTPNKVLAEKSYPSGNCHSHCVNKGPSSVGSIRYASLQRVKNPKSFGWTQWETHIIWVKKSHLLITFSLVPNKKKTTITKIWQHFFVQKKDSIFKAFFNPKKRRLKKDHRICVRPSVRLSYYEHVKGVVNPFNYRCWPALSIAPCMPLGRSFCHLDPRPWVICGSQAHDLCLPVIKDEHLNCVWICDPNSLTNKIIDISSESDSFFIFFSLFHKKYNLKFEKNDKNSVLFFFWN